MIATVIMIVITVKTVLEKLSVGRIEKFYRRDNVNHVNSLLEAV